MAFAVGCNPDVIPLAAYLPFVANVLTINVCRFAVAHGVGGVGFAVECAGYYHNSSFWNNFLYEYNTPFPAISKLSAYIKAQVELLKLGMKRHGHPAKHAHVLKIKPD